MAYENALGTVSIPANADLSTNQYSLVKLVNNSGEGQAALSGAGEGAVGILQDKPDAQGVAGSVGFTGISKLKLAGTVTAGGPVASNASGLGVAAGTGDIVVATAVESGVSGDIIPVIIEPRNAYANAITT